MLQPTPRRSHAWATTASRWTNQSRIRGAPEGTFTLLAREAILRCSFQVKGGGKVENSVGTPFNVAHHSLLVRKRIGAHFQNVFNLRFLSHRGGISLTCSMCIVVNCGFVLKYSRRFTAKAQFRRAWSLCAMTAATSKTDEFVPLLTFRACARMGMSIGHNDRTLLCFILLHNILFETCC